MAAAALLAAAGWARAEGPLDKLADGWRWRIFDREEGMSPGAVGVVYQDVDDRIYAAAERGLCRYDLHHWEIIENAQPLEGRVARIVESINAVFCASDRAVFTEDGGGKLRRIWPPQGDRPSGRVFVAASRLGEVFLIDEALGTHFRIRDRVEPLDAGVELPLGRIRDYEIDEDGVHWLATDLGLHHRDLRRRVWTPVREADLPYPDSECVRFLSFQLPSQTPLPRTQRLAKGRELWAVFRARGGGGWSLARLDGRWTPRSTSFSDSPVESITSDNEGNYYATCENGRVYFRAVDADDWQRVEKLGPGTVKLHGCLLDSRGGIWFRLGAGGVAFVNLTSERWQRYPGLAGPPYPKVLSLLETRSGDLWIGTEKGCVRYRDGAAAVPRSTAAATFHRRVADTDLGRVTALGEDALGRVWVGSETFRGVFHFVPETESWEGGVTLSEPIHRMVRDFRDELWFLPAEPGNRDAALYRVSPFTAHKVRAVPIASGLPDDGAFRTEGLTVTDLVRTQADVFWLATEEGLLECRLDPIDGPRLVVERRLTEEDGLVSSRVWDVEEGAGGAIWVCYPSSGRGVTRIEGESLTYYDVQHGLGSPEVWSILRSGRDLWFGTAAGLSRFDGECWYSFPVASAGVHSSLVFTALAPRTAQGQGVLVIGTEEHGCLRYQSDDSRRPRFSHLDLPRTAGEDGALRLEWRARDYKNETKPDDLIFRYRLDSGDWQTIGSRQALALEGVPVGRHTLELEVRDLDGNRNREGVVRVFDVEPSELSWRISAAALAGCAVLALLALGWRARRRREIGFLERCRAFYLSCPSAVLVIDAAGRIREYNGRLRDELGLAGATRDDDIIGRPIDMVPALAALKLGRDLEDVSAGARIRRRAAAEGAGGETPARVLDVQVFPLGGSASGSERRGGAVVLVDDATREVEVERLGARERRLRGMREVAGRLSRELGDAVEALRLAGAPAGTGDRQAFRERIERAEAVLRALREFTGPSQPAAPGAGPADLADLLDEVLGTREDGVAVVPRHVRLDYRCQTGLWPAAADGAGTAEALRAVVARSARSTVAGGTLRVRASNRRIEDDPGPLLGGSYIEVLVRGDGPGVDPLELESELDPLGPGDGLDGGAATLPAAYTFLRSQGGDLRVHSHPGAGITFRVLLPAAR